MILEAVWFKDGEEIAWVAPVYNFVCDNSIASIEVHNGLYWYTTKDVDAEDADDFVIRIKKEN